MKRIFSLLLVVLAAITASAAESGTDFVRISTDATDLLFRTAPNGRLYQVYLGPKLLHEDDFTHFSPYTRRGSDASAAARGWEAYMTAGMEDTFEPALQVTHADGNMSTELKYVSSETNNIDGNATETIITLRDSYYPLEVKLHYVAYSRENIIKSWSEISHSEKSPVQLVRYASAIIYFERPSYYLTEYSGDWAQEMQMSHQQLQYGKKMVDTKLGSRAAMHAYPFFQLGFGRPAEEQQGEVVMGTIGWTGNFRFTFEVDNLRNLRVLAGINPFASTYELQPGEVFTTPEFIFTRSDEGIGQASRNFHSWALKYQLKDGQGDRMTLLNNWENTAFNFDEEILGGLMKEAKDLGVDLFLLDDGWFGNKYPRNDDRAGLGDWEAMTAKLPNGVPGLVKLAKEAGVKFGIWVEPEMVNPKSELFEKHPDWVIKLPNRETYYYRNQLVLDLSNPEVQDYVFGVIDNLMTENPELAFFKWDCNSPITNVYSPYLKEKQSHLYVNHVRGVYNVFKRVKEKYPDLPMMLCSGGGARCDYEALKYFTEFWCSDNTDPVERLFIQWGFSQFFPMKAMCAHVTSWNKSASIKFRVDVAMMCKFGFDIGLSELNEDELSFCQNAVANYNRLKKLILDGDFYRLVSPYESNHTAVMNVSPDKDKALVYAYDIHPRFMEKTFALRLQGLDPDKMYELKEINTMPGSRQGFQQDGQVFSGDYLMKVGIYAFSSFPLQSRIFEVTAQ